MKKKKEQQEQVKKTSFVRLTRLDGSPIWLNASFVVTIEPRKGGGSIVVPIGDGLDYDVRETPDVVLACLDGAPAPEIVPVSTSDALIPSIYDLPSDGEMKDEEEHSVDGKATKDPPCRSAEADGTGAPSFVPGPGAPAAGELLEGEVARVRKMAPRTVKKLQNTIKTQFRAANVEVAISALVSQGIIIIDGTRVIWRQPDTAVKMEIPAITPEEPPPPELTSDPMPTPEPPAEPPPQEEAAIPPPEDEQPKKSKKPAAKAKRGTKKK